MIVYIGLALVYMVVYTKIVKWQTISRLGFNSETPQKYLEAPRSYHLVAFILFLVVLGIGLIFLPIPRWIGLVLPIICFFFASIIGRSRALKICRDILKDLLQGSTNEEEKQSINERLKMNDVELLKSCRQYR